MQASRRTFLKKSAAALTGVMALSESIASIGIAAKGELTGLQLYSVRDDMKSDPLGTLKKLSAMGYRVAEHANYIDRKFYGWTAREFKKILDDLGITMPSGHTVMRADHWDKSKKDFTDAWKYTVEDAAVLGQTFVISPSLNDSLRKSEDGVKRFMDVFNKSGELCKKSGMKFGYHNHEFEFNEKFGALTLYDVILQNTDPDLVIQQLDIGNMYNGGGRALDVINKYPGRFPSMHVKDEIKAEDGAREPYESAVLGKGIIDVKAVLDVARKKGGTKHFIIEQESYQGISPLESMKQDLAIMKKWGWS
jgi:sugar phosphate isomerase/epimerase